MMLKIKTRLFNAMNRNLLFDILILFTAALSAFLFLPVFHVSVSPSEFGFLHLPVFIKVSICFLIPASVAMSLFALVFHFSELKVVSRLFVVFLFSWVVLSGFLFPLVQSDGMIDASKTVIHNRNLVLVAFLSATMSLFVLTKLIYVPIIFCTIVISTSFISSFSVFSEAFSRPESSVTLEFLDVSKERNIFVISFDGVPGTVVKNVLKDFPELAAAFKDFVFFNNAVSQAPATHASIRSELFGNRNYHDIGSTNREVDTSLATDGLLLNNVRDSFTYGSYNNYNLSSENRIVPLSFVQVSEREIVDQHLYWMELLISRIGTPLLVGALKKGGVYETIKEHVGSSNDPDCDLVQKLDRYAGPAWKRGYIRHIQDYYEIVESLDATKKGLSIRYMHFLHSHYPVDFDQQSVFRGDDHAWHRANQNYKGLYNQCIGELSQFKMFLDKLRKLEIYNNSLIVFKSDHGKPALYYDFYPNDVQINDNEMWGVDRYMPLLMIKDFKSNKKQIEYNSDLVTLADLAKTLCNAAQVEDVDCDSFPGLNLLGDYSFQDSTKIYIEAVTTDPDSSFHFDTQQTIELRRNKSPFPKIIESSGLVALYSPALSRMSRRLKFSEPILFTDGQRVTDFIRFGWSNQEPTHRWTEGPRAGLSIRLRDQPDKDLLLRLKANAYLGGGLPYQTIGVVVNGREVATWQMKGLDWYQSVIPTDLVSEDGLVEVVFNISDPRSPDEVGESADTRKLGIAAHKLIIAVQDE
jgi:hypothetical protein